MYFYLALHQSKTSIFYVFAMESANISHILRFMIPSGEVMSFQMVLLVILCFCLQSLVETSQVQADGR